MPDRSRVSVFSLLPGLELELGRHLVLGFRVPVIIGAPATIQSRGEGALPNRTVSAFFGNLELEAAWKQQLAKNNIVTVRLDGAVELALPTGGGAEPPSGGEEPKAVSYGAWDQWAVMQAASRTRGSVDSSLFESGRLGVAPKIAAAHSFLGGKLLLRPSVKFEILSDVTGRARDPVIGELVVGGRVSDRVVPWLEPTVHFWGNIVVTDSAEKDLAVAVFEPAIAGHFGPVSPFVSVIVPVAGRLAAGDTLALRVGASAAF